MPIVLRCVYVIVGGLFIARSIVLAYFGRRAKQEKVRYTWPVAFTAISSLRLGVAFVFISEVRVALVSGSIGVAAAVVARVKGPKQSSA